MEPFAMPSNIDDVSFADLKKVLIKVYMLMCGMSAAGDGMEVEIKIIGQSLYKAVSGNLVVINKTIQRLCRSIAAVDIQIALLSDRRQARDLILHTDKPSVLLVEVNDLAIIDTLQITEKKDIMFMRSETGAVVRMAPVIAVFGSESIVNDVRDMPELICDWTFMPLDLTELARRIIAALKRRNLLKAKLHYGALTLLPEAKTIVFFGTSMHLTRSEFALAELFLSQMGSVIPLTDLVLLFRSTGKSTEGSNIRVTIFQLRLKLEMLTKGQYTLVSVYKQGYCLKQKTRSTLKEVSDCFEERFGKGGRYAVRG
jgi:DNA-binding response OmpR family regulator